MVNSLIIDDVKFTSINLTNILKNLNINNTKILNNHKDILELLKSGNLKDTEIIFLSLNLSISQELENSFAIIKKIKSIDHNIKIVVISESGKQQDILKAMQAGAFDYIEKPLNEKKIKTIMEKI